MRLTFTIALVAVALLFVTLCRFELQAKRSRIELRALRRQLVGDDAIRPLKRSAAPS
jgi:heme exporter protein C